MNDPPNENVPPAATGDSRAAPSEAPKSVPPPTAAPDQAPAVSPGAVPIPTNKPPRQRRDFFGEAVRELLMPFTGLIERKINPILAALEQIPDAAERLASSNFGLLDQPQARRSPLPQLRARITPERTLRPPGALTPGLDAGFESLCSRCGRCVEVCPVDAIQLDPNGLIAEGFPYIVAESQPCAVCDDLACMKNCPTGALGLVDRLQINMGTAQVDHQQCLRNHGEGCTLCIDICPIDGKTPGTLSALFISPESGRIRVRKNICIGCGLCENRCPTEPRAITVMPHVEPIDPIIA